MSLLIDVQHGAEGTILTPIGPIEGAMVEHLKVVVGEAMARRPPSLTINLSRVGALDPGGVSALLTLLQAQQARGSEVQLIASPGPVLDELEAAGLARSFPVTATT